MSYNCGPVDGLYGGDTTRALQKFLADCGHNPGPIDGHNGELTLRALVNFLSEEGYTDLVLFDWNGSGTTEALQRYLKSEGYDPGPIDGNMRSQLTVCALQRFLNNGGGKKSREAVTWFKMSAKELASKTCKAGELNFRENVSIGCTTDLTKASKVYGEVSAKVSGAMGEVNGKAGFDLSSSFGVKNSEAKERMKEFKMPAGSPGYIYQMCVECRTNKGNYSAWDCNLKMTDKPLPNTLVIKHGDRLTHK